MSPNPDPISSSVPEVFVRVSILKIADSLLGVIPTPLSETEICNSLLISMAFTLIFDPLYENFMAFDIRFLKIVSIIFLSAKI